MLTQIKLLTRLELCNLYGLNVLRFSKDKKSRQKTMGLTALWILLLVMLIGYVGGLAYGLIYLGLEEAVPAYLITLSGLLVFFFGMLKAGSVIFRKEGYDILCALPLRAGAIAVSRLLRMYAEDLLMTLAVLLPGIGVYIWNVRPNAGFYLTVFLGIWITPLIPMAASILLGALITGISSRMRHKSLISAVLSVLFVLGVLYGSSRLSAVEGSIDPEMLRDLSLSIMTLLEKVYPPAVWIGRAMIHGDVPGALACVVLSLAVFGVVAAAVALSFQKISQNLYSNFAKHDYRMGKLKADSLLCSLCKRELRRYFSSSIYVTNTIIGPVMGCVLSAALLLSGTDLIKEFLPLPIDVEGIVPFVISGVFCTMTATATSISMEGKNWWILKSLPLTTKNILDGKILMNLLLLLPFYLLSELILIFALKPGAGELLWLVLIPAVIILFSCVYGIAVNLRFPVLEWESEVRIVKQSASAVLGGMGGLILSILCAVIVGAVPGEYAAYLKAGICAVILAATAVIYRSNNHYDICGKI